MKIFVGGSLKDIPKNEELCQLFIQKLGETNRRARTYFTDWLSRIFG
jgi:hypothetical protein